MIAPHFSKDILEFLKLLFKFKVRYVIVGGEAVIYHGYARLTGDIDIFYELSLENVNNLYNALKEFWKGEIHELNPVKIYWVGSYNSVRSSS